MLGEWLRRTTARFMQATGELLNRVGLHPNVVTVAGLLLTAVAAWFLAYGRWRAGGVILAVGGLLDAVDGALARASGKASPFGAFLDSTLDRVGEALVYFGLVVYYLRHGPDVGVLLSYGVIVFSMLISYARARAEGLGVEGKGGLFTRFERLALLVVGLLLSVPLPTLAALVILSGFTAVQRSYLIWRRLRR